MVEFVLNEYNRDAPDETLLADLRRVARELGKSPTIDEYNVRGRFHASTLARRFGRWTAATAAAGLGPTRSPLNIPIEDLFENIEQVWTRLGRQPRYADMDGSESQFSAATYANRFGGWRQALERFVATVKRDPNESVLQVAVPDVPESAAAPARNRNMNYRVRFQVLQRDHFKCVACGKSPSTEPGVKLNVDHVVPWSRGGDSNMENLQTLCQTCNSGKSNWEPDE